MNEKNLRTIGATRAHERFIRKKRKPSDTGGATFKASLANSISFFRDKLKNLIDNYHNASCDYRTTQYQVKTNCASDDNESENLRHSSRIREWNCRRRSCDAVVVQMLPLTFNTREPRHFFSSPSPDLFGRRQQFTVARVCFCRRQLKDLDNESTSSSSGGAQLWNPIRESVWLLCDRYAKREKLESFGKRCKWNGDIFQCLGQTDREEPTYDGLYSIQFALHSGVESTDQETKLDKSRPHQLLMAK